jgi:hypothetical protein
MADSRPKTPDELRQEYVDVIMKLRALVNTPGWAYLCAVLDHQAMGLKLALEEAVDEVTLHSNNLDLRQAKAYQMIRNLPEALMTDFNAKLEAMNHGG